MLTKTLAAWVFALASAAAMGAPGPCPTNGTIADWKAATGGTGVCQQDDKIWALGSTNLADSTRVLFGAPSLTTHNLQIIGFDLSDAAASWFLNYTITVADPDRSFISNVCAGADNPGGGSLLTKVVTGDPGGPFTVTVADGSECPRSHLENLKAVSLGIAETFSVNAGASLLSVSNTYKDTLIYEGAAIPTLSEWALAVTSLVVLAAGVLGLRQRAK